MRVFKSIGNVAYRVYRSQAGVRQPRFAQLLAPIWSAELNRPCPATGASYNAAMLDIKLIREQTDLVRRRLATRGAGDEAKIDEVLKLDEQRRKLLAEVEGLKAQRNRVSKEIGALMGQKKTAEAEAKKAETRDPGDKIAALDKSAAAAEAARDELMLRLPNLPHESVAAGKDAADNPVMRK